MLSARLLIKLRGWVEELREANAYNSLMEVRGVRGCFGGRQSERVLIA